jgi:hypothetical protein
MPNTESTIRINGKDYNAEDLTLAEVEELEEACGGPLEDLDFRRAKVIKQVVYTLLKRDNPEVTLEEVGAIQIVSLTPESAKTRRGGNGASAKD